MSLVTSVAIRPHTSNLGQAAQIWKLDVAPQQDFTFSYLSQGEENTAKMLWLIFLYIFGFFNSLSYQQELPLNCTGIENATKPEFIKGEVFRLHNMTWGVNEFGEFLPCVSFF